MSFADKQNIFILMFDDSTWYERAVIYSMMYYAYFIFFDFQKLT